MKLKYIIISLSLICSISINAQRTIDKIIAQVGDNIILMSDIEAQKVQATQAGVAIAPDFKCNVLEELMFQSLLVNQAKLDSLDVSDAQVDAEMENRIRVIEQQIGGRQKLEEFYGKSVGQIKNEFRDAIRDRLLADEMRRSITENVNVTPQEVKSFYAETPKDSLPFINSKLIFQQIVNYPDITKEDKATAYNTLAEIRSNIVDKGKSFETQARINSCDPGSAAQGGKIQASRGMMVAPFEAAVFKLKPGEISEIFESTYGYHIVKLIERKGDDYVCQHILICVEPSSASLNVSIQKMDSAYALLKSGAITWDEAVLRYSNDDATRFNNGVMTNPISGSQEWDMEELNQVDQQIYLLTNTLEAGDISNPSYYTDVYERKQGMRIVRMMKRTKPHLANLTDDYVLIQSAAENNKKQKVIDEWTKGKINNTYIKLDAEYTSCEFMHNWSKK